mmetsp:Transcript_34818/g.87586  ORF Transcript_34818/g.87586 Transcript_34818/m.87586 type:complete len:368 (+) Transcript_34818:756-1859(+)
MSPLVREPGSPSGHLSLHGDHRVDQLCVSGGGHSCLLPDPGLSRVATSHVLLLGFLDSVPQHGLHDDDLPRLQDPELPQRFLLRTADLLDEHDRSECLLVVGAHHSHNLCDSGVEHDQNELAWSEPSQPSHSRSNLSYFGLGFRPHLIDYLSCWWCLYGKLPWCVCGSHTDLSSGQHHYLVPVDQHLSMGVARISHRLDSCTHHHRIHVTGELQLGARDGHSPDHLFVLLCGDSGHDGGQPGCEDLELSSLSCSGGRMVSVHVTRRTRVPRSSDALSGCSRVRCLDLTQLGGYGVRPPDRTHTAQPSLHRRHDPKRARWATSLRWSRKWTRRHHHHQRQFHRTRWCWHARRHRHCQWNRSRQRYSIG